MKNCDLEPEVLSDIIKSKFLCLILLFPDLKEVVYILISMIQEISLLTFLPLTLWHAMFETRSFVGGYY